MATAVQNRVASPSLADRTRPRDVSPAASRTTAAGKGTTQQEIMRQAKETWDAVLSYLDGQLARFGAPADVMRNNLATAVGIALFSVLIGTILLTYSLFGSRKQPQTPWVHSKSKTTADKKGFATKIKDKIVGMDTGMSYPEDDPALLRRGKQTSTLSSRRPADKVKQPGESYVDSAIHGLKEKTAPIKDAILNAKEKVVEATGLADADTEGMMDAAKNKIEDLATSAADMARNAYDAAKDATMQAADAAKSKVEELTDAVKSKASEFMNQEEGEENDSTTMKSKPALDTKASSSSKQKINKMASPMHKSKHDLDDTVKPLNDKAGHKRL